MVPFSLASALTLAFLFDCSARGGLASDQVGHRDLSLATFHAKRGGDAVSKIVEFLKTLEDQSAERWEKDKEANSEDKEKCKTSIAEIQDTVDSHDDEIEDLEAQVASLGAEVAALEKEITSLEFEKTRADNDLTDATRVNDQAVKDHAAAMEGYFSSIGGVENALELVASGAAASFSQIHKLIYKGPLDDDAKLLEGAFKPDDGPDSTAVLGTLKNLKATFIKEQGKLSDSEGERRRAFDKQSSDLRELISTSEETQDTKRADLGSKQEELATAEASLRKAKTMSDDANTLLKSTTKDCKDRRATFQKKSEVRRQEKKAMNKAIEILSKHNEEQNAQDPPDTVLLTQATKFRGKPTRGTEAQLAFLRRAAVSLQDRKSVV